MISLLSCVIDLLAPRACAICGSRRSVSEEAVCCACNLHLPRTHYSARPYDNEMAKLFWGILPVERAAALFFYEPHSPSSNIIYKLKYGGRPDMARTMGRMAVAEFARDGFFAGIDTIVPVPLAGNRQRRRGYNQSVEMARGMGEVAHLPVTDKAVSRDAFRESQTKMNRWQRQENVEGVFHLKDASQLAGKHVLIVDDVVTSGATVTSLAKEIMRAKDVRFSVVSLGFAKG